MSNLNDKAKELRELLINHKILGKNSLLTDEQIILIALDNEINRLRGKR